MKEWFRPLATYTLYALFAGAVFHFALSSQAETRRLFGERHRIQAEIARLEKVNEMRRKLSKSLDSDPFLIERLLRERYGYRRPDEDEPAALLQMTRTGVSGSSPEEPSPGHRPSAEGRLTARRLQRGNVR